MPKYRLREERKEKQATETVSRTQRETDTPMLHKERQIQRQTDRQTKRDKTETHRQRHTDRDGDRDSETAQQREREREREIYQYFILCLFTSR